MKKAILSVTYGSTDKTQTESTVGRVEVLYRREFPDSEIFRAFTSKHVISSLVKNGIHVDDVGEALGRIKGAGFDEVSIQPTHIISGGEYDGILDSAKKMKDSFSSVRVGKPLLNSEDDNEFILDFFEHELASTN